MKTEDIKIGQVFKDPQEKIWILKAYFTEPSVILEDLETGECQHITISGLTAESLKRHERRVHE